MSLLHHCKFVANLPANSEAPTTRGPYVRSDLQTQSWRCLALAQNVIASIASGAAQRVTE